MKYENLLLKVNKAVHSLINFLDSSMEKNIETLRISRVGTCLLITGGVHNNQILNKSESKIRNTQQSDGGWIDTEETLWCLSFIKQMDYGYEELKKSGLNWLCKQRHQIGGWGKSNRDIPRIPITGLLLHLMPELADEKVINWLKNEWRNDIQSNTRLTYKGGFFLMGLSGAKVSPLECPLIQETYSFLAHEQNEDGGFGPWKGHPIGSDPWSTGIVLVGILSYPELVKRSVIEKAVAWLAKTQLPNGLWPYHYIEEGSAYALWGLVEALKFLAKRKR